MIVVVQSMCSDILFPSPRELNHDIINLLQLGGIQADDDLSSLFGEDIDDEDDEEYQPAEEDYHVCSCTLIIYVRN